MNLILMFISLLTVAMDRIHGWDKLLVQSIEWDTSVMFAGCATIMSFETWYSWFGHTSSSRLGFFILSDHLGSNDNKHLDCLHCQLGKHHVMPFDLNESTRAPYNLIRNAFNPSHRRISLFYNLYR